MIACCFVVLAEEVVPATVPEVLLLLAVVPVDFVPVVEVVPVLLVPGLVVVVCELLLVVVPLPLPPVVPVPVLLVPQPDRAPVSIIAETKRASVRFNFFSSFARVISLRYPQLLCHCAALKIVENFLRFEKKACINPAV